MWRADAGEDGCNHMLAETEHPLEHANEALAAVRNGQLDGAAVLDVSAR
jgi:D-arabinose 1-dehydrogenase-like Zn-dependent alcohol dehydrogenase